MIHPPQPITLDASGHVVLADLRRRAALPSTILLAAAAPGAITTSQLCVPFASQPARTTFAARPNVRSATAADLAPLVCR